MADRISYSAVPDACSGGIDLRSMAPGTHLCSLYRDDHELARVTQAFVAAGLSAGDRVLYIASGRQLPAVRESLNAAHIPVEAAVASDQLLLASFGEMYGAGQDLDLAEIARGFRAAGGQARADGFPALRVAAEMGDFARFLGSVDRVVTWERMANQLQRDAGISSVCQYDRRHLADTDAGFIRAVHAGAAPDSAPPPLASYLALSPAPGLRVSGELDYANHGEFGRVLRARLAVYPRLELDVQDLSFADLSIAGELYRAAADLPAGGAISLVHVPYALRRVLELAEMNHPRLILY
jgi:anti-anti-sigma regulatory factor